MPRTRVAERVQARREHADPEPARKHGEDPARDAALRGQADRHQPLAREVVHPARRHHAEDVAHDVLTHRSLAGDRIDAAVRERRGDHGEVAALDRDRALAEVQVERVVGPVDHTEAAQHVGHAAVAVPGVALRAIHRVVDLELAPRVARVGLQQARERVVDGLRDEARAGDRPGVDQRVARHSGERRDADLVERVAAGLHADATADGVRAQPLECEPIRQRLGHGLDRERGPRVADLVDRAVDRRDADTEERRIDARELGDVARRPRRRRARRGARGGARGTRPPQTDCGRPPMQLPEPSPQVLRSRPAPLSGTTLSKQPAALDVPRHQRHAAPTSASAGHRRRV